MPSGYTKGTRNNDSVPAMCFCFVSNLDPLDISALSLYFKSVFSMCKIIGGVGRRESGSNSAIGKEVGRKRPGKQDSRQRRYNRKAQNTEAIKN